MDKFNIVLVYTGPENSNGMMEDLTPNKPYPTEKIRSGEKYSYVLTDDRGCSLLMSDDRKEKFFKEHSLKRRAVV